MHLRMKRYDAYIFDFDNTLVDSEYGYSISLAKAFAEFDMPYDESRYNEYIRTPLSILFNQYHPNSPCRYRDFVSVVTATYSRVYLESVRLFPDAEACIDSMTVEGIPMGIASNSYTEHLHGILRRLGLQDRFLSVIGIDKVSMGKPDPEAVLLCAEEMDMSHSDIVMVGDSENDIRAGAFAGMETILIDRAGDFEPAVSPTFIVSSLIDMIQ